jgi:uncharacterized protein YjbK
LSKELEIEFKNMLTKEEYVKLLADTKKTPISQTNHYFDTADFQLRRHKAALRIRQIEDHYVCTLKTPAPVGNYETTDNLTSLQAGHILEGQQFDAPEVRAELERLNVSPAALKLIGSLTTYRAEIEYAGGLLVLDHSQYCGIEDYELEYEVTDEVIGKEAFFTLLKERAIPIRPADKKIARFMAAAQQQ